MVFQLCSFSAFLFHRLLIMSFYYFCFALPKLRTSDYHNHIDCLMCYEWVLKITNSTVPTFLKSIISIKSDFYVISLYKNYYYQIRPTVTNFPQVNNQAQAWVLCSLELKMLVTPKPGLYDTDAYNIFQSYMRPVAFTKYHLTPTVVTLLLLFHQWGVIVLKEVHLESQVNQSRKSDGNCIWDRL